MKPLHLAAFILFAAVFAEILVSNTALQVTRLTIRSKKCPAAFNGFTIVQLSDLHSKEFGHDNIRLLRAVKTQSPDMIVMTGDMVDRLDKDFSVFFTLADSLAGVCPVYYIPGNHEQSKDAKSQNKIKMMLNEIGVRILENDRTSLNKDGQSVNLFGFDSYIGSYEPKPSAFGPDFLKKVLGRPDPAGLSILMAHDPVYFDAYSEWGADLTLCGHMHGGMIRLPFLGPVFSPEKRLFPKYGEGDFSSLQNTMVVNRGLGNGRIGFRFLNRPEIIVITLKSD
jgi:predicted MPP superfamily phosphohydrolase